MVKRVAHARIGGGVWSAGGCPGSSWSLVLGRWSFLMALVGLTASGCGDKLRLAPVSGKVSVNGKPLERVGITFTPIGGQQTPGPGSSGVTDASGRFTLQTIGDRRQSGAIVGKHRVTMYLGDSGLDKLSYEEGVKKAAELSQILPPTTRDGSLTFEVPAGGTSEANFDFKGSGP